MSFISTAPPVGAIQSVENLARALDIPLVQLRSHAEEYAGRYRPIQKPKKNGKGYRTVYNPSDGLKSIQRAINSRIFRNVRYGSYLFGGIRDLENPRDYIKCAAEHCSAGVVAKVDLKNFFDSVTDEHIRKIFSHFFSYSNDVTALLTRLTTIDEYRLPQGAPTSVALANLAFFESEERLVRALARDGVRYTRFIDDIVVSHRDSSYDIDRSRSMVENMVERHGYTINTEKTVERCRSTHAITVFGMRVNGADVRVPKSEQKNLRAALYQLESWASIPNERKSDLFRARWNYVSGSLAKLKRTNNHKYRRYRRRMRRIMPLVHERELNRLKAKIRRLVADTLNPIRVAALQKRHDRLLHEVGIVGRTHENLASDLRLQLREAQNQLNKA